MAISHDASYKIYSMCKEIINNAKDMALEYEASGFLANKNISRFLDISILSNIAVNIIKKENNSEAK